MTRSDKELDDLDVMKTIETEVSRSRRRSNFQHLTMQGRTFSWSGRREKFLIYSAVLAVVTFALILYPAASTSFEYQVVGPVSTSEKDGSFSNQPQLYTQEEVPSTAQANTVVALSTVVTTSATPTTTTTTTTTNPPPTTTTTIANIPSSITTPVPPAATTTSIPSDVPSSPATPPQPPSSSPASPPARKPITSEWLWATKRALEAERDTQCQKHNLYAVLRQITEEKIWISDSPEMKSCLWDNRTIHKGAHKNEYLKNLLWQTFTGRRKTISFGVSGGSSMTGAGPGVGPANVFINHLKTFLDKMLATVQSETQVEVRNIGQGYTGSLWGGYYLDELLGGGTDVLFWEFVINDFSFQGPDRAGRSEALEVWYRRALRLNPVPAIGMLQLWDQPNERWGMYWPGGDVEKVQKPVMDAYAERYDMHSLSIGEYARATLSSGKSHDQTYETIKKYFVADWHHPSVTSHITAAEGFLYIYSIMLLEVIDEIMRSGPENLWPEIAERVSARLAAVPPPQRINVDEFAPVTTKTNNDTMYPYALDHKKGGFVFFGPTFNEKQSFTLLPCKPNVDCDPKNYGKTTDTSVRLDSRMGLRLPSCSSGTLAFAPTELIGSNETIMFDKEDQRAANVSLARYVGFNVLGVENTQPLQYDPDYIRKILRDTCVLYNGEPLNPYFATAGSLARGVLAPIIYFERVAGVNYTQGWEMCKGVMDQNAAEGFNNLGTVQICSGTPYPMTSMVVFFDEIA